jgi:hypothetical protein
MAGELRQRGGEREREREREAPGSTAMKSFAGMQAIVNEDISGDVRLMRAEIQRLQQELTALRSGLVPQQVSRVPFRTVTSPPHHKTYAFT